MKFSLIYIMPRMSSALFEWFIKICLHGKRNFNLGDGKSPLVVN